jgi:hypothetical protein
MSSRTGGADLFLIESAHFRNASAARRAVIVLVLAAAGIALAWANCMAEPIQTDGTARYFRELRRRGLFRLAETYCLERLSRNDLAPAQRADLTIELARALAEHAAVVQEPERAELWDRARTTLEGFLKREPDNPRLLLIEAQAALLPATIGHVDRQETELEPFDEAAAQKATKILNDAVEKLRALERRIAERLRKPPRGAAEGELKQFEVRSLGAHVRFRLASALIDLAYLSPAESPERAALLLEAQKIAKSVPEAGEDAELVWLSRLAFVECSRLLGDPGRTLKELDILEKQSPPPEFADRLLAERVRTLMAQKRFAEAAALLDDAERRRASISGEFALLGIELPFLRWQSQKSAADAPLPDSLLKTLEERLARIPSDGDWKFRGERLVQQLRDINQYGPELAGVAGKAQSAFAAGRDKEAIESYGEAAALAHSTGRSELAFHFGFTRASIEIKARKWTDAAADLSELVEQFPKNPKAAEAHLLAAFALGRAYDEKPTPARREEYTRALEEHRARYAGSPTVREATWMLAKLNERRGKITAALEQFKSIPREHKRGAAAEVAIASCYESILERLREIREPVDAWQEEAVATLREILARSPKTNAWSPATAEVAMRLARILLHEEPPQFAAADKLLIQAETALGAAANDSAEAGADAVSPRVATRALVRQLQVISLAGQGRFVDARELLQQLSTTSPAELLRILDGIAPLRSGETDDPFHDLGELQLEAALRLDKHRTNLAPAEQRRLDECLARAYVAVGQTRRGIEIYEALLQQSPRDRALMTSYAELLTRCGTADCLKKAVTAWRKLEGLCEEATPEWFAMRYQVCHALVLMKETQEACKLVKVTRLVYPKIDDPALQKKFAELEARCANGKTADAKK